VVTKNTEPWTVYAGSPAKPIKKRDSKRIIESAKKLMNYE
jgi:acetyltransferase-like isoleucine patch superfamily enzyme